MSETDLEITVWGENGQAVDPPPGTTYRAVVSMEPADEDVDDEPPADAECAFWCDPQPFRELIQKPMDPAAPTVFAPVLLACDSCHELYPANDRPGLENDP